MEQWEYRLENMNYSGSDEDEKMIIDTLNQLGEQGWELVSSETIGRSLRFVFKRRKSVP